MVKETFQQKVVIPLIAFLKQGMTPGKLALTVALGALIGLFPVIGSTTILCTVIAFLLRLNMAVIQLVNYLVYPLQLILFLPLIRAGVYVFDANPLPFTLEQIVDNLQRDTWNTLGQIWYANMLGIAIWGLLAIPLFAGIYFTTFYLFKKVKV